MGKKSKILYYSVLVVNVICFILDLLPINFPFFRISFALSLMLIGLLLFSRAITLKLDSSMFIGTLLFLFGVLNIGQLQTLGTYHLLLFTPIRRNRVVITQIITEPYILTVGLVLPATQRNCTFGAGMLIPQAIRIQFILLTTIAVLAD